MSTKAQQEIQTETTNQRLSFDKSTNITALHHSQSVDYQQRYCEEWFKLNSSSEQPLKQLISAQKLDEAGALIGTSKQIWNPQMKIYLDINKYTQKVKTVNGSVRFEIIKFLVSLWFAYVDLKDLAKGESNILIVGTNNSSPYDETNIIKEHIKSEAQRIKGSYVNQRWLGGTLTNYRTIEKSINKFNELLELVKSVDFNSYTKKERSNISKQIDKYERFFGGIRTMARNPKAIIIIDPVREHNAVEEAKKKRIPIIAITNSNASCEGIKHVIPANTNSPKTIWLILTILCDAICEGRNESRQGDSPEYPIVLVNKKESDIIFPPFIKRKEKIEKTAVVHKKFTKTTIASEKSNPTVINS